jgi:2-polyprenyl-3-methyl-5-hydroxy-6-metoxy-1,4-benzoquinol methylase
MHQATLKSSRYDVTPAPESFIRNKLFVDEAKKYSRVLECGCSNGFLSKLISAGGSRVVGLDIDGEATEQARPFCARVLSLDLNENGWTKDVGEQFDLVTFGDVLEHLVHPQIALREAMQILAPGGRVLICLPNIAHWSMRLKLLRGHFEYEPLGLLDFTHLRFFTVSTAKKMIEDAGYKIVRFQPVYGGMVKSRLLPLWQKLAGWLPNALAIQMIFVAEPLSEFHADKVP